MNQMVKNVFRVFLVFAVPASLAYAQTAAQGKTPKVIDPFSESYQNNVTAQSSLPDASSAASYKVKYISAFTENSTDQSLPEDQDNTSAKLRRWEEAVTAAANSSKQIHSSVQADITGEDFKENYTVLKSN